MLSAVIIEDEKKYLQAFKSILASACPDVTLLGDAGSIDQARQLIGQAKPDIVFLDIQLADGNAFELLNRLERDRDKHPFDASIIFTTASNQHAIQAFRFSAVDYLLKPIISGELSAAVKKAEQMKKARQFNGQYQVLLDNVMKADSDKKICLRTLDEMRICQVSDITRCAAEHNYTTFYFTNGKPLMISKTIKEYEEMLRDHGFERVHQSHLVNLKHIKSFVKKEGGFLLMNDGAEVPVARRKKDQLLEKLKKL